MSDKTPIEWTATIHPDGTRTKGATWNPIRGTKGRHHCTKVSPACQNCYAERMNLRFSKLPYTKGADTFRLDKKALAQPGKWRRPRKIFVCSMTDLFHEDMPDSFIVDVWQMMLANPRHTFIVLTKRSKRLLQWSHRFKNLTQPSRPHRHIWIGVTVENQQYADERIPDLLQTPAAVRFLSIEPLLGPIDLTTPIYRGTNFNQDDWLIHLGWIIVGGESGPKARPMHPIWVSQIRNRCLNRKDMGRPWPLPFFFKQWGEYRPVGMVQVGLLDCEREAFNAAHGDQERCVVVEIDGTVHGDGNTRGDAYIMHKIGKKKAGRLLDGLEWNEFPIQEAT